MRTLPLLTLAFGLSLAACGKDDNTCATDADCFSGEVCERTRKVCETPAPDMAQDMTAPADMPATPDDMRQDMSPSDMAQDMDPADSAPDMDSPDMGPPPPPNKPAQLVAGSSFTCARFGDGKVRCWGSHTSGQLGIGRSLPDGQSKLADPLLAGEVVLSGDAVDVQAGWDHACALLKTGEVQCWGSGLYGQLGNRSPVAVGRVNTPAIAGNAALDELPAVIGAGARRSCAARGHIISCWGDNPDGALGRAIAEDRLGTAAGDMLSFIPLNLTNVRVIKLTMSTRHTCALTFPNNMDLGAARCWGSSALGRLGEATNMNIGDDETLTQSPSPATQLIDLAAGSDFTCGVTRFGGKILCWGDNTRGQLGDDSVDPVAARAPVALPLDRRATQIVAGASFACALDHIGAVWCWGKGELGQLGQPATMDLPLIRELTAPVNLARPTIQLAAGTSHVCALHDDRSITCWGSNIHDQLGRLPDETSLGLNRSDLPGVPIVFE